jgi:hypothetical protein
MTRRGLFGSILALLGVKVADAGSKRLRRRRMRPRPRMYMTAREWARRQQIRRRCPPMRVYRFNESQVVTRYYRPLRPANPVQRTLWPSK